MNDKEFLQWIHDRIVHRYGENKNMDFMHRLRKIITTTGNNITTESADIQTHEIDEDGDFIIESDHPDPDMSMISTSYFCEHGLILWATDKEWAALNAYREKIKANS